MILFLKAKAQTVTAGEEATRVRAWEAASREGMNVSVIWVEGDQTYAFIQVINPGNSML